MLENNNAQMCFDAGVAVAVFGMPVLLAFTLGSLLQAVGPALLVPLLFGFQQQRMGTHQGEWPEWIDT